MKYIFSILILIPALLNAEWLQYGKMDQNSITIEGGIELVVKPGIWKESLVYFDEQNIVTIPKGEYIEAYNYDPESGHLLLQINQFHKEHNTSGYYSCCMILNKDEQGIKVKRVLEKSSLINLRGKSSYVRQIHWYDSDKSLLIAEVAKPQKNSTYLKFSIELWDISTNQMLKDFNHRNPEQAVNQAVNQAKSCLQQDGEADPIIHGLFFQ